MAITILEGSSTMEDPLIEIIFLTIAAVISGSDHFTDIQMFGQANLTWLRKFLPFTNGIPSLDVSFREDESRIRNGSTPDNFAVIRHICMNLLKQETSFKRGIKGKRYRSVMDS